MLYQELPAIDAAPLDRWSRWLVPVLIAAAGLTAALLLFLAGQLVIAGMLALAGMVAAVVAAARGSRAGPAGESIAVGPDFSIVGSAIGLCSEPAALTSAEGSLLISNAIYRERFGAASPPLELGEDEDGRHGLSVAKAIACAWPIPSSGIVPIQTGIPCSLQMSYTASAGANPPTR